MTQLKKLNEFALDSQVTHTQTDYSSGWSKKKASENGIKFFSWILKGIMPECYEGKYWYKIIWGTQIKLE